MAYIPIPYGAVANDHTGIPNRNAWTAVDTMFQELYAIIGDAATQDELDDAIEAITLTVSGLTDALANKADQSDVDLKAAIANVIVNNATQAHTNTQRRQMATNSGAAVAMPFEVLPESEVLGGGAFLIYLPRFPLPFTLMSVALCAKQTSGAGLAAADYTGTMTLATLANTGGASTTLAEAAGAGLPFNNKGVMACDIVVSDGLVPTDQMQLTVAITKVTGGAPDLLGLTLWLRGVWAA